MAEWQSAPSPKRASRNHDAIRILSQKVPQKRAQVKPIASPHSPAPAPKSFKIVFPRLLRSDQLGIDRVDFPQTGVGYVVFPDPVGPGRDENAVRVLRSFRARKIVDVIRNPSASRSRLTNAAIEHAQNQASAY